MDPKLDGKFPEVEVSRCIHIGLLCIQEEVNQRPTMGTIVSALNGHVMALSDPKPPLVGPSVQITTGCRQHLGLISSNEYFDYNDYITEVCPR